MDINFVEKCQFLQIKNYIIFKIIRILNTTNQNQKQMSFVDLAGSTTLLKTVHAEMLRFANIFDPIKKILSNTYTFCKNQVHNSNVKQPFCKSSSHPNIYF